MKNNLKEEFTQLCVVQGLALESFEPESEAVKEAVNFIQNHFSVRIKFDSVQVTKPTPNEEGTGGRNDFFFYIHNDDIMKFSVPRFELGIRWWEDVLLNGNSFLYSEEFLESHPKTW